MASEKSPSPADVTQTVTELRQVQDELRRAAVETSQILTQLTGALQQHQQILATLDRAQGALETTLYGDAGPATETGTHAPLAFSDHEATRWAYEQLQDGAQNETDLLAAFTRDFALPAEQMVSFLSNHRFFRKTGTEDNTAWMISGNRHDDLRDYLAG